MNVQLQNKQEKVKKQCKNIRAKKGKEAKNYTQVLREGKLWLREPLVLRTPRCKTPGCKTPGCKTPGCENPWL